MSALGKFIRSVLKPVARFSISHGIKFQEFTEFAKQAFIDSARSELKKTSSQDNISKMAVMTGLQRRDVTRLINNQAPSSESLNLLTKIIGQWANDRRFSKKGKANDLTFGGVDSDFFKLVQSVSKDINPYTVLFELERIRAVEKKNDKLLLAGAVLDTSKDKDSGLALLANDVDDLLYGVEENIFTSEPVPNLHITTRYDNIQPEAVPQIKLWFLEKGAAFHQAARAFLSRFDRDINTKLKQESDKVNITLGSFSSIRVEEEVKKKKKISNQ
jgi:hypothetical protein